MCNQTHNSSYGRKFYFSADPNHLGYNAPNWCPVLTNAVSLFPAPRPPGTDWFIDFSVVSRMSFKSPNQAPVALDLFLIVSVSSSGSAAAAGSGPFRGLYFTATAAVNYITISGTTVSMQAGGATNTILWVSGAYVQALNGNGGFVYGIP